jgi:hypothetical protein
VPPSPNVAVERWKKPGASLHMFCRKLSKRARSGLPRTWRTNW